MNQIEEKKSNLVLLPVSELNVSTKNPRSITKERLEALMESIKKDPQFLIERPILATKVNNRYVVYAGTQRLAACKELGLEKVPVIVQEELDNEVLDYRMLLDNVHRGQFDAKLLEGFKEQLRDILDRDDDFIDTLFDETALRGKAQSKDTKPNKSYYTKLQFQTKEDLNIFYDFLDELQGLYPNVTLSQRLLLYLSQQV